MESNKIQKICEYIMNNNDAQYDKIIEKEEDIDVFLALSKLRKNIINWYEFKENSEILEINGNFGEITGVLCEKAKNVTTLEKNNSKAECISKRYSQHTNLSVITRLEDINNKKYDYIIIINESEMKFEIEKLKKYLKDGGTIIYTIDNKFGIKNINRINKLDEVNFEKQIINDIKKSNFNNYKIYYIFHDYKIPNIIFDKNYILSKEDLYRNFKYAYNNELFYRDEKDILEEIYQCDTKLVPYFANSLFIEISQEQIKSKANVIYFNSYRKDEFQLITKIENNEIVKKLPSSMKAINHINNIKENIIKFDFEECKILDKVDNEYIYSEFIKGYERFDEQLSNSKNNEELISKFRKYANMLYKKSEEYNEENINPSLKFISKDILSKFKYLKNAYIDMIPKNCFYINGEYCFFDQEWAEEYFPVEFIIYRAILNMNSLEKEKKELLYKEMGLLELIPTLKLIEKKFFKNIANEYNLFSIFYKENEILSAKYEKYKELIEKQEIELKKLRNETKKDKEKINDLSMQLQIISKSKSWQITKPLRYVSEKIYNIKNKKNILINPLNTFIIDSHLKKYKKITDIETARYWIEIEKRINKFKNNFLPKDEYENWVQNTDITAKELKKQAKTKFNHNPKISIIVPLYNTPIQFFRELLYSVVNQTYLNWELCLADGSNEKNTVIEKMCSKDSRIKYKFIGENKGISGNTNEALKLATGDYIALLDHDDLLPLNSLYEVVKVINKNPKLKFIYTDEDKISEIDQPRYSPHFKPDFAKDFLRSNNYICHFSFFEKTVMEQLGGFRDDYNGAQDFDIILRMSEIVDEEYIEHIPKILYHWRVHRESTASKPEAKPYAYYAGKKAVQDHINRLGLSGNSDIEQDLLGVYKINYDLLNKSNITIFVCNNSSNDNILECIDSIVNKTKYSNYDIRIIDKNENIYSKLNNEIKQCDSEYIVILDSNSIIDSENWLEALLAFTQRKDVAITSLKIINTDDTIKHAGIYLGVNDFIGYPCRNQSNEIFGYCGRESTICNMNAVTNECMMFKKSVFEEVEGFDENLTSGNYIDFCLKAREKNYLIVYEPHVKIYSKSNEYEEIKEKDAMKIKNRWKEKFENDNYYNPNLKDVKSIYIVN